MASSTKRQAIFALELTKAAGLVVTPAVVVLLGFAWFVRNVREPIWILIGLVVMTVAMGVAIFLISGWFDRKMSDDAGAYRNLRSSDSSFDGYVAYSDNSGGTDSCSSSGGDA